MLTSADKVKIWQRLMNWGWRMGCHQLPERSFFIRGYQCPVCARCTGVLLSTPLAVVLFFFHRVSIPIALGLSSVMLLDWGVQFLHIRESTNPRRLITGIIGGFGVTTLYMYLYLAIYRLGMKWVFGGAA